MKKNKIQSLITFVTYFTIVSSLFTISAKAQDCFGNYECVKHRHQSELQTIGQMREYVVRKYNLHLVKVVPNDGVCGTEIMMEDYGNTPRHVVSRWTIQPGDYYADENNVLRYRAVCMNRLCPADDTAVTTDDVQPEAPAPVVQQQQSYDWSGVQSCANGVLSFAGQFLSNVQFGGSCQGGGYSGISYDRSWSQPQQCEQPREHHHEDNTVASSPVINNNVSNYNSTNVSVKVQGGGKQHHKTTVTTTPTTPVYCPPGVGTAPAGYQPGNGTDTSASGSAYALSRPAQPAKESLSRKAAALRAAGSKPNVASSGNSLRRVATARPALQPESRSVSGSNRSAALRPRTAAPSLAQANAPRHTQVSPAARQRVAAGNNSQARSFQASPQPKFRAASVPAARPQAARVQQARPAAQHINSAPRIQSRPSYSRPSGGNGGRGNGGGHGGGHHK